MDLEPRRRALPRRHPDRGPLPRPRAPARTRQPRRLHARHRHPAWLAARLEELDNGDTGALAAAARQLPLAGRKARELAKAPSYLETSAHRMRYAHYRRLGMFTGSGAVEAGCKAITGQRLKLSCMRWTVPGATSITTLRCQEASGRWEQIWHQPDTAG